MCLDPASLTLSTFLQIGSAVVSFANQTKQLGEVASSTQAANEADNLAAAERYRQIDAESTDKMSARAREARIEQARIRAISADSGLSGVSGDRLIDESVFNAGTDIATMESNRRASLVQAENEARAVNARNQTTINRQTRPSLIGTGLQIAGAVVDADTRAQERKNRVATAR